MGKRIIGVIAFAAIAVAAGWNYQQNKQEVKLSNLALANVQALARDEWGDDHCKNCVFTTSSICWMSDLDGCMGYRTGTWS